jgi:hypothetical protein
LAAAAVVVVDGPARHAQMPRNGENVAGQPLHFLAGQAVAPQMTLHAAIKNSNMGLN